MKDEAEKTNEDSKNKRDMPPAVQAEENHKDEADPFGLDAFIPKRIRKDDRTKGKKETGAKIKEDEEEYKRFLKSQREALITCLEIAAHRYKTPWLVHCLRWMKNLSLVYILFA